MTSPSEARLEMLADPEALSRRVADWMLEVAMVKDGAYRGLVRRFDPAAALSTPGWIALSRRISVVSHALVLGRRTLRLSRRHAEQLPHGARGAAIACADSGHQRSSH